MTIEARNIKKSYLGEEVLHSVSFKCEAGEICLIKGRSGSGKTTLLNICGSLDIPDEGNVIFQGVDMVHLSDKQRAAIRLKDMSFIFQDFGLFPFLKVWENVGYKLLLNGISKKETYDNVHHIMSLMGIESKVNHYPAQLSGGQQQRVGIARAFATNPKLLIADEPTANLDEKNAKNILKNIQQLSSEKKAAVIIASHDSNVDKIAHRTLHIKNCNISDEE